MSAPYIPKGHMFVAGFARLGDWYWNPGTKRWLPVPYQMAGTKTKYTVVRRRNV